MLLATTGRLLLSRIAGRRSWSGRRDVKIADGPEKVTVADMDGLLYLPGPSREKLERALRIPAISQGWQSSFQAMLTQKSGPNCEGNQGLANEEQAPAWPGFRKMRVARIHKESDNVTSFVLEPSNGQRLPICQASQIVVLGCSSIQESARPSQLRSPICRGIFRVSIKNELNGIGSSFYATGCERRSVGGQRAARKLYAASKPGARRFS